MPYLLIIFINNNKFKKQNYDYFHYYIETIIISKN